MINQADVNKVRNAVKSHTGKKVKVRVNRGRHRIDETVGIISETYSSIFLVTTPGNDDMPARTMSYSYTDVLTKDIELILCR